MGKCSINQEGDQLPAPCPQMISIELKLTNLLNWRLNFKTRSLYKYRKSSNLPYVFSITSTCYKSGPIRPDVVMRSFVIIESGML